MAQKHTNPLVWLGLATILAVGLIALFAAVVMPYRGGYGMMGWGMGWGALFMAVPAVFLILVLLAALGAFQSSPTYPQALYGPPASPALETLNVRYARGEISREEYLRIRSEIEGGTPRGPR